MPERKIKDANQRIADPKSHKVWRDSNVKSRKSVHLTCKNLSQIHKDLHHCNTAINAIAVAKMACSNELGHLIPEAALLGLLTEPSLKVGS